MFDSRPRIEADPLHEGRVDSVEQVQLPALLVTRVGCIGYVLDDLVGRLRGCYGAGRPEIRSAGMRTTSSAQHQPEWPGHSTTNPGRFRFSEPKPYTTQEPNDAREPPRRACPVFIISIEGRWLTLSDQHRPHHEDVVDARADLREDVTDLDAALAVRPELERRLHEPAGGPIRLDLRPGIGWPSNFARAGFGSNVSTCDSPPLR